MTPRRQRLMVVGLVVAGVALAAGLALRAFNDNLLYFYTPTQVAAGEAPAGKKFRLGGLVQPGSLHREPGQLKMQFQVTDVKKAMTVNYSGILPDLFREGQGVIAYGVLLPDGSFRADEVLAKHDENYMPPEVAQALREQGHPGAVEPAANP
ncbi:Cytochrome c-type biogenesis protein CcmE [Gammaproteobacteria bacterium]|nr:cytochrome c maturation protein CcmE [Gammaproteobacteria bacterium]QOJ31580.1 MAG: cytochrome c maturation protein CcmE [Gammaproteobacteria bacterium]CAG0944933.1 Cytochrome c-type biogenesis protein CcmE [Gammaproteobacteria bacterium]